ncbi:autotransporter outer membrane beta-barrel domain-containing protein [Endomicrobium proavitum]|uniref:Autotransporter domain-containing protein n=1 Tax=Endomicrobium proavitum TaxID=1408281 RepID=A0A0G3WHX6_9BACT|nr:autotransporter outer membrane beta-barrel domain-containing protein [Endomicrobium proavitum]AKL97452.1 exported protein of unknown function [Endomicrobium proavitum]
MKKILFYLTVMCVFAVNAYSQTVSVSSFTYLQQLYQSGGSQDISLTSNISFADWLGAPGFSLSMSVDGQSLYSFDGAGAYGGFYGDPMSMGSFSFNNTALKNFVSSGAVSVTFGTFNSSNTSFSNNGNVLTGGAVSIALSNSQLDGNIVFSSNSAGASGGAFAVVASDVLFTGNSYFYGNTAAVDAGALLVTFDSYVTFNGSSIYENNVSTSASGDGYGGAVAVFESTAIFSYAEFSSNLADRGGAIAVIDGDLPGSGSYVSFGDVIFNGNTATSIGGAVYADGSVIDFNGDALFQDNNAQSGGAVRADISVVNFNGDSVAFSSNHATYNPGGAFYLFRSTVNFNSAYSSFSYNASNFNGGAIFANYKSSVLFSTGAALFEGNRASLNGGAVYALSSNVEFQNVSFINNTAQSGLGGAVYIAGTAASVATATFRTSVQGLSSSTVFSGNAAGSSGNGMYIGDYSKVYFITDSGASVEMYDNIASGAGVTGSKIYISGAGYFNLYANSLSNKADVELSGNLNFKNGAALGAGMLTINPGSFIDMLDGATNSINAAYINNAGRVDLETFDTVNDSLNSSGALVLDAANSVLNVTIQNYTPQKRIYKLFSYGSLAGQFNSVNILGVALLPSDYQILYGTGYDSFITLILNGDTQSNFSAITGLTFNQSETAKIFDNVAQTASGDLLDVILEVQLLSNTALQKDALGQSAGYFLANVLRNAAIESSHKDIYDKMNGRATSSLVSGIWAQAIGGNVSRKGDENSINEFRSNSSGAMIGYDKFDYNTNVVFGLFGKYKNSDIKQDPQNSAAAMNAGAGIYVGWISEYVDIKVLAEGGFDNYDTSRYIPFVNRTATAKFNGLNYGGNVEAAAKIPLIGNFKIRPYAGFEAKNSSYEDFKESGAGSLNLNVKGGNYFRSAARGGIGFILDNKNFSFYVQGEGKYLTSGDISEIESAFDGAKSLSFKTRGYTENKFSYGAGVGVSLAFSQYFRLFANGNYYSGADKFEDLYANAGIRIAFGDSAPVIEKAGSADAKPAEKSMPLTSNEPLETSEVAYQPPVDAQNYAPKNPQLQVPETTPQDVSAAEQITDLNADTAAPEDVPQVSIESALDAVSSDADKLAADRNQLQNILPPNAVPVTDAPVAQPVAEDVPEAAAEEVPSVRPSIIPDNAVAVTQAQPAAFIAAAEVSAPAPVVVEEPVAKTPAVVKPAAAPKKAAAVKPAAKKAKTTAVKSKAAANNKKAATAVKKAAPKKAAVAAVKKAPAKKAAVQQAAVKKKSAVKTKVSPAKAAAKTVKPAAKKAPAKKASAKRAVKKKI